MTYISLLNTAVTTQDTDACMYVRTYTHPEVSTWKVCSTNSAWNSCQVSTECIVYLVGFSEAVQCEVRYKQT